MKSIKSQFVILLGFLTVISCNKSNNQTSIDSTTPEVKIIRDHSKKAYLVFNEDVDQWSVNKSNQLVLKGSSKQGDTIYIPNSDTIFAVYQFLTPNASMQLAEEHLPMTGGYNYRDLGGIETKNNKITKRGLIFRSDDLFNLNQSDLDYLSSIPLITIVDFRSEEEIKANPDKLPSSVKKHDLLNINPGNVMEFMKKDNFDSIQCFNSMKAMNKALVTDSASISEYREFFKLLQDSVNIPLLFHCSAGKDRTGMGAALILYALGVSEDLIYQNYLESNLYLADKYKSLKDKNPNMTPLFEVHKEYLQAGFDEMKAKYGSVDNYLVDILNVDTLNFRRKFLTEQ